MKKSQYMLKVSKKNGTYLVGQKQRCRFSLEIFGLGLMLCSSLYRVQILLHLLGSGRIQRRPMNLFPIVAVELLVETIPSLRLINDRSWQPNDPSSYQTAAVVLDNLTSISLLFSFFLYRMIAYRDSSFRGMTMSS